MADYRHFRGGRNLLSIRFLHLVPMVVFQESACIARQAFHMVMGRSRHGDGEIPTRRETHYKVRNIQNSIGRHHNEIISHKFMLVHYILSLVIVPDQRPKGKPG